MNRRVIAAALGAAALAVPATAAAGPGHGQGRGKPGGGHVAGARGKGKVKAVKFVFKGIFAADGTVKVTAGNAHVRKGGFVGQTVSFDLTGARVVVADTNADQKTDLADVKAGDVVLVKADLGRGTKYAAPAADQTGSGLVAKHLIDKTNAPDADEDPIESGDGADS